MAGIQTGSVEINTTDFVSQWTKDQLANNSFSYAVRLEKLCVEMLVSRRFSSLLFAATDSPWTLRFCQSTLDRVV